MKIELEPEEITFTSLENHISDFSLCVGKLPEYLDFSLKQYNKLKYLCTSGQGLYSFRGIPIYVQGTPLLNLSTRA